MREGIDTIKFAKPEEEKESVLTKSESIRDEIKSLNPENLSLDKLPNDTLRKILTGYKRIERVISGKDESKELLEGFETAKSHWMDLYKEYGIDATSLENLKLTDAGLEKQREKAEKYGFDKTLMIPAGISPAELIKNDAFMRFSGSEEENQTSKPGAKIEDLIYFGDSKIKTSEIWNKKLEKPQVIFLKNKNHVDTKGDQTMDTLADEHPELVGDDKDKAITRNQKYPQIEKMEDALDLEGLDFMQAMILDRDHFNSTGHHLFDYNDKNITWLTKTKDKITTGRCARFHWDPDDRQWVVVLWNDADANGSLGSVFSADLDVVGIIS